MFGLNLKEKLCLSIEVTGQDRTDTLCLKDFYSWLTLEFLFSPSAVSVWSLTPFRPPNLVLSLFLQVVEEWKMEDSEQFLQESLAVDLINSTLWSSVEEIVLN